MVRKMEPHMARDKKESREVFKNGVVPCEVAYEKFVNQRFEEEDYSMSKKLLLGLDYMDSIEYYLFALRLTKDFSKLSSKHGLLINDYRESPIFTRDGTRVWHSDSDCYGKPINHDRFWVITELCVGSIDEASLIAKINDFGQSANGFIKIIGSILEPTFEES